MDKPDDDPMDLDKPDDELMDLDKSDRTPEDLSDQDSNSTVPDKPNRGNEGTPNEDVVPGDEGQGKDETPLGTKRKLSITLSAEAQKRAKMNLDQGILVGPKTQLYDYEWKSFVDFTPISQVSVTQKPECFPVDLVNTTANSDGRAQGRTLTPKEHAVEVVQYQDWISKEFPPARRQAIFHSRCILIWDAPHNIYNFNSLSDMEVLLGEETLYNFGLLKNQNSHSFNANDSHFEATLDELIKSAELRQAIINCLDIPIPSTKAPGCQGLATQAEAEGHIGQRVDQEGVYWAITGQKGAYSLLHMDANGLCTVVEPMTGQKY
ncbi:hypothetical protein F5050DRAFT_1811858 [Lentinula boryana]|uniref:Uncharacterized protein n=1 Tax=Lentinula boryana TaxID=40481 RepID=A0ABQ8Q0D6_9AGAR|nr:hypothetical protein F5050DRAFT_1811858 [Lentinula boryana]